MCNKACDGSVEYSDLDQKKYTLAGEVKEWNWFKIYVFTKEPIDLIKELNILNSILASHGINDYE